MRILITGHTGFKGSWLTIMLNELGHEIHGVALNPLPNGIFDVTKLSSIYETDNRADIRDKRALDQIFLKVQPEVVFHLAAQPLVLKSYEYTYDTYSTNVSGTLNVLDSATRSNELKAVVVVTTDKVYKNDEKRRSFIEEDLLGGKDPYSASKALADLLTQGWSIHYSKIPLGIARAGNVIGGGDVSPNRLIPDLVSALEKAKPPLIRSPKSVRPWQHVLDCLSGYVALMEYLVNGGSGSFNFGPEDGDFRTVEEVADYFVSSYLGPNWIHEGKETGKESEFLTLDSGKAKSILDWRNRLTFEQGLDLTIAWQKATSNRETMFEFTQKQIREYFNS